MDPDNPVRPVNDASLTHVQRWVLSVLAVFTIAHLAIGLVIAALSVRADDMSARIGLTVIAGIFGVLAVAAGQLIHRRNPLNAWLLLGLLPGIVGLVLVLR
jgi:hypothetical protein